MASTEPELPLPQTDRPVTSIFLKLEVVGKGGFGSVHRGIHLASGSVVALKIIEVDKEDDDVDDIQREIALLSRLRGGEGCNITRYWGSWQEDSRVWIAMDYAAGGSLMTLMKPGLFEERYTAVIVRETLIGLSYLHREQIIHRDIKAANILLTSRGRIMLADFGVSALLVTKASKRMTVIGTPHHMAPEVIKSTSTYNTKADIWSLGITIYELVTGEPPHSGIRDPETVFRLVTREGPPSLPHTDGSEAMREFVRACLTSEPTERPSADELLKHKWLKPFLKNPVSLLTDLIRRYKTWEVNGGVRQSIVELDEQEEIRDDRETSTWEFNPTLRSPHTPASPTPPNKYGRDISVPADSATSTLVPRIAPLFARNLFTDDLISPPTPKEVTPSASRRHQAVPQPMIMESSLYSPFGKAEDATVKPQSLFFPARIPGAVPPKLSLRQSQSGAVPANRPAMAPGWSFLAAPGTGSPRPRAPSNPTAPARELQAPGSVPRLPPLLLRANSAMPWTTMQGKTESTESLVTPAAPLRGLGPRRPGLARLGSAMAVMGTSPGVSTTPPLSTIGALLDPVEGKDQQLPPLTPPKPGFSSSDPDFLPPSPTSTSHLFPMHLQHGSMSSKKPQLTMSTTLSSTPSSLQPSRYKTTSTSMPSTLPPEQPLEMPPIRHPNYGQLGTSEGVHVELANTVEGLRDWMSLVQTALTPVLEFDAGLENNVRGSGTSPGAFPAHANAAT